MLQMDLKKPGEVEYESRKAGDRFKNWESPGKSWQVCCSGLQTFATQVKNGLSQLPIHVEEALHGAMFVLCLSYALHPLLGVNK